MTIDDARKEIDKIDKQLMELLLKRLSYSRAIGELKHHNSIPIFDKAREVEIFNKLKLASNSEYEYIKPVFMAILQASKDAQNSYQKENQCELSKREQN